MIAGGDPMFAENLFRVIISIGLILLPVIFQFLVMKVGDFSESNEQEYMKCEVIDNKFRLLSPNFSAFLFKINYFF